MTTACPRAPRGEKKKQQQQQQHTDRRGEDKKKNKSNIGYVWIYEIYIFRCETQTFQE